MAPIQGILRLARIVVPALVMCGSSALADGANWQIRKSSGDVWLDNAGSVQQVSLTQDASLKPGDSVRTGRNGRVLLVRGEETILVSPNTAITLPKDQKDNLSTTIVQQAGSILLEVEKRNVKHFQVETPYLAAVVKGTQFRVTVGATGANVAVVRGQVEVADFRSGQIAQVMPGQTAASLAQGNPGLSLSGRGQFSPIQNGAPRAPSVERLSVPRAGLTAPRGTSVASRSVASGSPRATEARHVRGGGLRISAPIGEVRLNVHRSSNGLAHASGQSVAATESTRNAQGAAGNGNQGNGNQNNASGSSTAVPSAVVAAPLGSNAFANGNGNAASSNGNRSGQTANLGNGNVGGSNAGTNGNGNGGSNAGGNGNGNGNGGNNAGGNGNGNGNGGSNAGGNGNGRGNGGSNAGGNGNGNGNSGSNAGGNGNGNGNSGSNAGGNGNGNGNSGSNAGGNGNGNGNSGSNGNGNGGGNSNAGGNGNGNGIGRRG